MWNESLDPEERDNLGPDQRVVVDHYLDEGGRVLRACERITSDPADLGTDFSDGSWDRASFDADHRRAPKDIQIVCRMGRFFRHFGASNEKTNCGGSVDSSEAPNSLDQVRPLNAGPDDDENTLIPDN